MSPWRPGLRRPDTTSMVRVDQAGEFGATRIYAGQLAVLRRNSSAAKLVSRMADQERRHLLLNTGRTEHPGPAEAGQTGGRVKLQGTGFEADRPKLIRRAPIAACSRHRPIVVGTS